MDALVTDADGNHALAVVRSLGRQGLRVAAADSVWGAKSFFSRYCAASARYPSPTHSVDEFLSQLHRIVTKLRPRMLMPMTERTILALTAERRGHEAVGPLAPFPSQDSLRVAFNKKLTIELAESLGIGVPKTVSFSRLPEFDRVLSSIAYPAVVKPRRSEFFTTDNSGIVPGGAPEYCMRPADLEARYLAVHKRAPLPLIQEFVPGEGYGICVLCRRGKIRALFAHRRLRMVRPTGSGSSLRESIAPPADMVSAARKLLDALQWHGVAMVEFKRDARDGTPKLMEINGRFWNSLPLADAAGVDFPLLLYRMATEGDVHEQFDYRVGVKCRWLAGDFQHLLQVFRGRPAGWTDSFPTRREALLSFLRFFERDLHYDNLWPSDPLPFVAEMGTLVLRRFPELLRRQRTHAIEQALPAASPDKALR